MAGTNIINHATETQSEYPPATISDATIHVNKANAVVSITPSNNRPNVGQSYTYTVTVKVPVWPTLRLLELALFIIVTIAFLV